MFHIKKRKEENTLQAHKNIRNRSRERKRRNILIRIDEKERHIRREEEESAFSLLTAEAHLIHSLFHKLLEWPPSP